MAWMLAASDWASGSILVALAAALAGVIWSGFYIIVSGVRRTLVGSDETHLLMRELQEHLERQPVARKQTIDRGAKLFLSRLLIECQMVVAEVVVVLAEHRFGDRSMDELDEVEHEKRWRCEQLALRHEAVADLSRDL